MIIQCCDCKRVRLGQVWIDPLCKFEAARVTHTYCPVCINRAYRDAGLKHDESVLEFVLERFFGARGF